MKSNQIKFFFILPVCDGHFTMIIYVKMDLEA